MTFVEILLLFSIIVFLGYFIKSVTGFAGALFSVPLLVLFFDVKLVVPVVSIVDMLSGFALLPSVKKKFDRRELVFVIVGTTIGTALGTYLLRSYANDVLKVILGIVVGLFALRMFFENVIKFNKIPSQFGSVFGALGGITGGMFSTNGPPIIIYLSNQIKDKQVLRGTLIYIFLLDSLWRNSLLLLSGSLNDEMYRIAGCMIPVLLLASYLGSKIHLKLNDDIYRRSIAGILLISSLLLVF